MVLNLYDAKGNRVSTAVAIAELGDEAPPGPSGQGGVAGQAAAPTGGMFKARLLEFTGRETAAAVARWLDAGDRSQTQTRCDDEQMASAALTVFKGDAQIWLDAAVYQGKAAPLQSWPTLKTAIRAAFIKQKSVPEIIKIREGLKQRTGESSMIFFNRIVVAHGDMDIHMTPEDRQLPGYQREFDKNVKVAFINGLDPKIRDALQAFDLQTITEEQLLTMADNAELNSGRSAPSAGNVEAFGFQQRGGRGGRGGYSGGRGGAPGAQGGRGGYSYANATARGRGSTSTYRGGGQPRGRGTGFRSAVGRDGNRKTVCFRCGLIGTHMAKECRGDLALLKEQKRGKFAPGFVHAAVEASLAEQFEAETAYDNNDDDDDVQSNHLNE